MKVRATKKGFYDKLREKGDEFTLSKPSLFSKRWMEKVTSSKPKKNKVVN